MRQGFAQPGRRAYQKGLLADRIDQAGEDIQHPIQAAGRELREGWHDLTHPFESIPREFREGVQMGREALSAIGSGFVGAGNAVREAIGRAIINPQVTTQRTDPQGRPIGPATTSRGNMGSGASPGGNGPSSSSSSASSSGAGGSGYVVDRMGRVVRARSAS